MLVGRAKLQEIHPRATWRKRERQRERVRERERGGDIEDPVSKAQTLVGGDGLSVLAFCCTAVQQLTRSQEECERSRGVKISSRASPAVLCPP